MGVLSAPTTSHDINVLSIVILAVSILSAIGAGWIILSFSVSFTSNIVWGDSDRF